MFQVGKGSPWQLPRGEPTSYFPIFAKAKQTHPPGDTTKQIQEPRVVWFSVSPYQNLAVCSQAFCTSLYQAQLELIYQSCIAQLLIVKDFRETRERNLSYLIGNSNLSQIFSSAAQHHPR